MRMLARILKPACYLIAICELLHSLYFVVQAMIWINAEFSALALVGLLCTMFWACICLGLLVGLCMDAGNLVGCWLLFALSGLVVDILVLIYGLATGTIIGANRYQGSLLLVLAIVIEGVCTYIIYLYYKVIRCERPEGAGKKRMLDKYIGPDYNTDEQRKQESKRKVNHGASVLGLSFRNKDEQHLNEESAKDRAERRKNKEEARLLNKAKRNKKLKAAMTEDQLLKRKEWKKKEKELKRSSRG